MSAFSDAYQPYARGRVDVFSSENQHVFYWHSYGCVTYSVCWAQIQQNAYLACARKRGARSYLLWRSFGNIRHVRSNFLKTVTALAFLSTKIANNDHIGMFDILLTQTMLVIFVFLYDYFMNRLHPTATRLDSHVLLVRKYAHNLFCYLIIQ